MQGTIKADSQGAARGFLLTLLVTAVIRTVLAAALPITGDEAYFYYWGRYPDWGFYDHPPMVGWWLAALRQFSEHPLVLRLPALLAPVVIALIVRAMLRRIDTSLAWQAAMLVLLVPLNAWNVAITTDIPLMIFGAATVAWYLRALRTGRAIDFLICGVMLGGALLSKYFAGMLALAIAGHCLWRVDSRKLTGLVLIILGTLPSAAVQIVWNAHNCWPNLMFNLVNRHDNAGWSLSTPVLYAVSVAYVLTPPVAWWLLRGSRNATGRSGAPLQSSIGSPVQSAAGAPGLVIDSAALAALRWFTALPFALFALLSLVKKIGLHWLASFVAPAIVLFMATAQPAQRRFALNFALAVAIIHYLLIAALAAVPLQWFARLNGYPGIVMTLAPDDLSRALAPWRGRFALAADGYSPAVTMGFNLREYVFVFGIGSSHARHDDILTDLRKLDGRDILIIHKDADRDQDDARYFERIEHKTVDVRGARFHLTEGYGFKYPLYRDLVLDEIRRRWYQVPGWLPAGACYFCDRYFPDRPCHR